MKSQAHRLIFLIFSIFLLNIACVYAQDCDVGPDNRRSDILRPQGYYKLHTGDRTPFEVVNGAKYWIRTCWSWFDSKVSLHRYINGGVLPILSVNNNNGCPSSGTSEDDEEFYYEAGFTGTLWVTITDENCGYSSNSANLYIDQLDNVDIEEVNDRKIGCASDATFTVSASLVGPPVPGMFTYQWQRKDGNVWRNIAGKTSQTLTITNVQPNQFGTQYRVGVTLGAYREYSNAASLIEQSVDPPSGLSATDDICTNEIKLQWEWYHANPSKFKLEFSEGDDNDTWSDLAEASGTERRYTHENVTRGMNYHYRIKTFSDACGDYTTASSPVTGISPAIPFPPTGVQTEILETSGGPHIRVSWEDQSDNEIGFIVSKIRDNGNTENFRIQSEKHDVVATGYRHVYEDEDGDNCEPYTYRVYSYNVCIQEGVRDIQEESRVTVTVPINKVVNINSLETTPGYHADKVAFDWTYEEESNYRYAGGYKIYGRELSSGDQPELIYNGGKEIFSWSTDQVKAGVLYEYFLIAAGLCGDIELYSYPILDSIMSLQARIPTEGALVDSLPQTGLGYGIGFRSPSGLIHGNVAYAGGISVPDVRVIVNRSEGATGGSLFFDGVDDYVILDSTQYLEALVDSFSISTWVRPERITSDRQFMITRTSIFTVSSKDDDIIFFLNDGDIGWISTVANDVLTQGEYTHITVTYKIDVVKIYINGEFVKEESISVNLVNLRNLIANTTDQIFLGGVPWGTNGYYYQGYITETRLHSSVLDSTTIKKDYSRFIAPNTPGLVAYWRMEEGSGPYLFDFARSEGIFHQNDGRIRGATWSNTVPDQRQLGMAGYTNTRGNYTVNGIFYTGNGNSFEVTPTITLSGAVHEFSPSQRLEFIGEANSIINDIDFDDISSFRVTGEVVFDYNGTLSGSEGVSFFIDGSTPIVGSNGNLVTSAEDGSFDIQVPIGQHSVVIKKAFHTFKDQGKWPTLSDKHNFQDVVNGITFIDETRRTLIGRVVGGLTEADKLLGFDLSSNNIGQARFVLKSQDQRVEQPITTKLNSGEFVASLPPKRYTIYKGDMPSQPGISVTNNPDAENYFVNLPEIDLSNVVQEQVNEHPVYEPITGALEKTDTVKYHLEHKFIYRSVPQISVTDGDPQRLGNPIRGEETYTYTNLQGTEDIINLRYGETGGTPHPIFNHLSPYKFQIALMENYENRDIPSFPRSFQSPVTDGELTISNYIGKGYYTNNLGAVQYYTAGAPGGDPDMITLESASGDTIYSFVATDPNLALNSVDLDNSFTRTVQITARAGGNVVYWPGPSQPNVFRAYVFGSKPLGTSFITRAPDMVDFILRDPPGSGSTAEFSRGSSITQSHSFSVSSGTEVNIESKIGTSASMFTGGGIGVIVGVINEASAQATLGLNFSVGIGYEGQWVETYTTEESFGTSEDLVGSEGDLYAGKSQNLRFGLAQSLSLVPDSECSAAEVACPLDGGTAEFNLMSQSGTSYQIGSKIAFFLSPEGLPTFFIYTQKHIEEELIPQIKELRNTIFLRNSSYSSNVAGDHDLYASNNDDPRWPSPTSDYPKTDPRVDFTGPSYTFSPPSDNDIDSVRWYNQQVRLWEASIAKNEQEKIRAFNGGNGSNKSFSALSSYTSTTTTTSGQEHSTTFETSLGLSYGVDVGISIFGVGIDIALNQSFTVSTGYSYAKGVEETVSFSYTLSDGDAGDFFSVDVFEGENNNGPIFIIRDGGESSCPHEEAFVTKYHSPGTTVGAGTLKRDVPRLEIAVPTVYNVPSDEAAVYTLNLYNDSHARDPRDYVLSLVQQSNPYGAIISIDGNAVNHSTIYGIPANTSIQKTMLTHRGPHEYAYEDISIEMQSACDSDIVDDASFSAYYTPTCTDIEIASPKDKWVVNSSFKDTLDITLGGYNINYVGLENIELRYKPSNASSWVKLETFYKDTTGMNNPEAKDIPKNKPTVTYRWDLAQLPDATYDLIAVANCTAPDIGTPIVNESEVFGGLVDRVRPHAFGRPQPADGVLSPQDEIMIQFNEAIHSGLLSPQNFDIRGVLNGGDIRHPASVSFDGDPLHYMRIGEGAIDLRKKSFTIDMYVRRGQASNSVILSQGELTDQSLSIGFTANNRVFFTLASKTITSSTAILDAHWHHVAVTYNLETSAASISIDAITAAVSNQFSAIYQGTGEMLVGKSTVDDPRAFNGHVHELRVWNKSLTEGEVAIAAVKRQTRASLGLIANWRMEEGNGSTAKDHIRSKHAEVLADWMIEPSGQSLIFSGSNQYAESSSPGFSKKNDFSVEFWFKSELVREVCFLSNGRGDAMDSNVDSWALGANASGNVFVRHNNATLESSQRNYHDGNWHHFALIVNRVGNTLLYVDGEQLASSRSEDFKSFAGSKLWVGTRGWYAGSLERRDLYLQGAIDELRIWNIARSETQLNIGRYAKLRGDEVGLIRYYPFETYVSDAGILTVVASEASIINGEESNPFQLQGSQHSTETPPVQLARPVSRLPFNFSANGDRIIISPNVSNELIENIILDITVKDVLDLNGNTLASPVTWSLYVDRNQTVWEEESRRFDINLGESLEFSVNIRNNSGAIQKFNIHNMPEWIQVSPSSGSLSPLSGREISFTIQAGVNIGQYIQDIYLTSEFGFDERLILDIKIKEAAPEHWFIDPNDFQFSMNIIAQIRMDGILSRDEEDQIAAFVGNEARGVASLQYFPEIDSYIAFLSIYSNQSGGESLSFKVWNASEGQVHSRVTPDFAFGSNSLHGNINSPVIFEVPDFIQKQLNLTNGWQWISFNTSNSDMSSVNDFMSSFEASESDIIKSLEYFDQYDLEQGWIGSLSDNQGLESGRNYKVKLRKGGQFLYEGDPVDSESMPIALKEGWNWIGLTPQNNLSIQAAFSRLNPEIGDQIKGQLQFSIYAGGNLGWVGTLKFLEPHKGYMFYSSQDVTFTFPNIATAYGHVSQQEKKRFEGMSQDIKASAYQDNMTMIVELPGMDIKSDHVIIAYVDGQERGVSYFEDIDEKQKLAFITVLGQKRTEEVSFQLKDLATQEVTSLVADRDISFQSDALLGSLSSPVLMRFLEQDTSSDQLRIMPNPFSEVINIAIENPKERLQRVEIYSTEGARLAVIERENMESLIRNYSLSISQWIGNTKGVLILKIFTDRNTYLRRVIRK